MKFRVSVLAACICLLPAGLWAQSSPVVVELFTSQGCSSCPPADALMHRLAERDDVIPLALHVDYWDYIGWKDEYARAEHTGRQKKYAALGGRNMIYTPQMIINGLDDVVGAKSMELSELIMRHKSLAATVVLSATRDGSALIIRAKPAAGAVTGPLDVQVVRYQENRQARITRGENAGKTLDYANVVDDWTIVGQWDGQGPMELRTPIDGDRPAVVLIQKVGPGAILAAARAN